MTKAKESFKTIANAVYRDQELRAVKSPKVWRELKKSQTLGLRRMNLLAQACKMTLVLRASSVEKINILDRQLNTPERIATFTPNFEHENETVEWEQEEKEGE